MWSNDCDNFVLVNANGSDNLNYISDNWLDVSGNPCIKYILKVSEAQGKISGKHYLLLIVRNNLTFKKYHVLTKCLK